MTNLILGANSKFGKALKNYKITINEDGLITELGKSTIWEKND